MKLKNLALLPLIVVSLNATTATNENVTRLYVADFERAPDAAGLKYWVETSKLELEDISQSFFDQDETKAKYPDTLKNSDFVNEIYKNTFNRDADPDGQVYWTKQLTDGIFTKGKMILAIINGAQDTTKYKDKGTIDNKTEVGLYFVASGSDDVTEATKILDGINDDHKTVVLAQESMDEKADEASSTAGKTYILTKSDDTTTQGLDTITGTSADDIIIGYIDTNKTISTYGGSGSKEDNLNGGAGNDTLKLTFKNNSDEPDQDTSVTMIGVENVIITDDRNETNLTNATNLYTGYWSGVENYTFIKGENKTIPLYMNINSIKSKVKSLNFADTNQSKIEIELVNLSATTNYIGTSIAINTSKAEGEAFISVIANYEGNSEDKIITTYTVDVRDNKRMTTLNLNSSILTTVVITGNSDVNLEANSTKIKTIDASALSNDKSFIYFTKSEEGVTIKGSNGDDIIMAIGNGDDIIIGGKGEDDINITDKTGIDTIQIDASTDLEDEATKGDKVTGFIAGTDKISIIGLPTGAANNFIDGNKLVDNNDTTELTEALKMANSVLSGNLVYANIQISDTNKTKYLFFDTDSDGMANGVIQFIGNTGTDNLKYSDIK